MNIFQEIFLVSYSILYGIMLNGCIGLDLFSFGRLYSQKKAGRRIITSFIIVNLGVFLYFAKIYLWLETIDPKLDVPRILGVFFLSLSVFAFYRLIHIFIAVGKDGKKGTLLYDLNNLSKKLEKRLENIGSVEGQITGALFYFLLAVIGYLILSI
jgi:hypothetical protein